MNFSFSTICIIYIYVEKTFNILKTASRLDPFGPNNQLLMEQCVSLLTHYKKSIRDSFSNSQLLHIVLCMPCNVAQHQYTKNL